jgi:hypothetical protein
LERQVLALRRNVIETTVDYPVEAESLTTRNAITCMEQVCTGLLASSEVLGLFVIRLNGMVAAYGAWNRV